MLSPGSALEALILISNHLYNSCCIDKFLCVRASKTKSERKKY